MPLAHLTRTPIVGKTVTYFMPITGKRRPAQVIAVYPGDINTVDLRLADGTVRLAVPRSVGRQGFGSWGFVRGRSSGSGTIGGISFDPYTNVFTSGKLKAAYDVSQSSGITLVSDDFTRTASIGSTIVSDTFTRLPVVTDDFSEADGTNLSGKATDTGQTWEVLSGGWSVVAGRATEALGGQAVAVVNSGYTDVRVTAIPYAGASNDGGIVARCADDNNYYMATFGATGANTTVTIYKRVAGAFTSLGAIGSASSGAEFSLEVIGTSLKVYTNGGLLGSTSDSSHTTGTKCGLRENGTSVVTFDNFSVTRADLGTAETGQTWGNSNTWGIGTDGRAHVRPGLSYPSATIESPTADYEVQFDLWAETGATVTKEARLYIGGNTSGHTPYVSIGGDKLSIHHWNGGTDVNYGGDITFASLGLANFTIGSSKTFRAVLIGQILSVYVSDKLAATVTITPIVVGRSAGFGYQGATSVDRWSYDNFSVKSAPTGVSDDFSEVDGTSLSGKATDTGQVWTTITGAPSGGVVTGNKVVASASTEHVVESGYADAAVSAFITAGNDTGLLARATGTSLDYLLGRIDGNGTNITLYKRVAGTFTSIGGISSGLGANLAGATLELRCIGTSIVYSVNGVAKLTITESAGR